MRAGEVWCRPTEGTICAKYRLISPDHWIAGGSVGDKLLHCPTSAIVLAAAILLRSLIWPAPREHANGGGTRSTAPPTRLAPPSCKFIVGKPRREARRS